MLIREWKAPAEVRGQVHSEVGVTTSLWAQRRLGSLGGGLGPGGQVEPEGKVLPIALCRIFFFFFKEFENESGKIRRGIYMVFEGFPLFYKYFIFSIKKKPLGGLKGRREKVKLCAHLLWCKSGPIHLISVRPRWICQSVDKIRARRAPPVAMGQLAPQSSSRKE